MFWWTIAIQLGGGMTISNIMPKHTYMRFLASVVAGWSMGLAIFSIGLSGAPAMEPLMEALGMKLELERVEDRVQESFEACCVADTSDSDLSFDSETDEAFPLSVGKSNFV